MVKMFSLRNLGIRGLIGLTLGVMLAVILGLSAVAYLGLKTAADGYEYMLNDVAVVSDTVDRIESGFTNAELALLQYSLFKEEARGAQAVAVLQKVRDEIGFLEHYIRESGLGSTDIIAELRSLTTLYRVDVSSYLDTTSALGIDTYSGIQGTHWAEGNMLDRSIRDSGDAFIENGFSELRRYESEFMRNGTDEAAGSVSDYRDAILDYLAALAPTEDRVRLQDLLVSYTDDFDTMRRNKTDSDGMLLELMRSSAEIARNLGRIASEMDVVVADVADSVRSRTVLIEAIMGVVVAVSFTLATLVGINLFRRIGRPMGAILEVTDAMASGRLDKRAGLTRNDEMGHIAGNIDRAGETLAEIIRTIQGTVTEGTALSDRLGTVAEQTAAAFTQVSANISSIDASTDVMDRAARSADAEVADIVENLHRLNELAADQSASVEESTASVEEMVASISNVNDIAEEKSRVAGQLADQAAESRESVRRTGRLVEEINSLTEGIGSVIGMINSVASRTNLLAMNAAIEAAHAGDAGRGFAVVADEVRKLAETTGSNAKSISDSLGVLVDRVAQVQEAAAVSRKTIDQMTEEAQGFTQSFSEIASSMNEMNLGSQEVLGSTQSLAEITRELNDSIERMRLQAESAGKGVRSMRNMAGQVSEGVGEIGRASVEIRSSAEELTKDGNGNRALMQRLFGLSERFVVQDRALSEIGSAQA